MRYLLPGIMIFIAVACTEPVKGPNGVIYKSAREYNNYIIERQRTVGLLINSFYEKLNNNPDSARELLPRGIKQVEITIEQIKGMPVYQGDSAFRNAAVRSFGFYKSLFANDYPRIVDLHRKKENMDDHDNEEVQKISKTIMEEEEKFDISLHNAQKEFAEKNKMKLVDNSTLKKD